MNCETNGTVSIYRKVSPIEFRGIINHTIPIYDEFGKYNLYGLAVVRKGSKYGVVNRKPVQVIPFVDNLEILRRGIILTFEENGYFLYNRFGKRLNDEPIRDKMQARIFARRSKR